MNTNRYKRRVNFRKKIKKINKVNKSRNTKKGGALAIRAGLSKALPTILSSFSEIGRRIIYNPDLKKGVSKVSNEIVSKVDLILEDIQTAKEMSSTFSKMSSFFSDNEDLINGFGTIVLGAAFLGMFELGASQISKRFGKTKKNNSVGNRNGSNVGNGNKSSKNSSIIEINTSKKNISDKEQVLKDIYTIIQVSGINFKKMYNLKQDCPPNINDLSNNLKNTKKFSLSLSDRINKLEKKTP